MDGMLSRVPEDMDKREGSMIYNALAPAAMEIKKMYIEMDVIMKETYIDTASREGLVKRAYERAITPYAATPAVLKGEFNMDIPLGTRFSLEELDYTAVEKIEDNIYKMECETAGEIGNTQLGRLIPNEYIQGLTSAELTEVIIPGEDEEDTESIRKRYFDSLSAEAFGGNREDYRQKVDKLPGVGGVKVYPAWNGGGTVKLEIIDSNYVSPSSALIAEVQTAVDPTDHSGEGVGVAPIGHHVTVVGVAEEAINIQMSVTYAEGWDFDDIKPHVESAIDEYLLGLKKGWEGTNELIVRISQIETRVLDIDGVIDIEGTTINGSTSNHVVNGIPKRGTIVDG